MCDGGLPVSINRSKEYLSGEIRFYGSNCYKKQWERSGDESPVSTVVA